MNLPSFYRGLLCALAERTRRFVADGDGYHGAFRAMLVAAREQRIAVPDDMLANFDPMFGRSPHASAMLFEGLRDCVLWFEAPYGSVACFTIPVDEAREWVDRLDDAADFRTLADALLTALPACP